MVLERLYDATDNLINQQFYKGGHDIIIGRTPEISLKISNSGQIIRKFKDLFNQNLDLFLDGKYLEFLNLFKRIKGMDENYIREIYQDLQLKFETLKEAENINTIIIYSLVLNSLISSIRDLNFGDSIKEIKKRILRKSKINENKIQEELDKLFMRNDHNISILYNISYLDTLAESFNYKKVAHICKIQKSKFINRIVRKILFSLNKV
ncbi:MAG: hypothetical protein CEE43_13000 [Promethearchaeota archaeon Loki_b32]|nr:MAG: hypothetical protein CEE43_13000 [Candidatus Lokiarchaeota archaeon Loki_b32]